MAIPDGKPATDFSAMNREWVRAVADEAAGSVEGGIPAPANPSNGDVLTYSSTDSAWVAAAIGVGNVLVCTVTPIPDDPNENVILDKTWAEIYAAASSGVPVLVFEDASASPDIIILFDLVTSVEKNSDTNYLVQTGLSSTVYASATENGYPQTTNS